MKTRPAPDFAVFDPSLRGVWYNDDLGWGYNLSNRRAIPHCLWRTTIVYDFEPVYEHPLYFWQRDGVRIACPAIAGTDQGSVPPFAQAWLPEDGILGYYPHDGAARDGGLFFMYPGEKVWTWRQVTRAQSDRLLQTTAQCDPVAPVGRARAWSVKASVWCAHYRFHEWRPGDDIPTWPEQERPDVDDPLPMGAG